MESFTPLDYQRVLKYLKLPFSYRSLVISQMNSALTHTLTTPEERSLYVVEAQAILTELDTLETKRTDQVADGDSSLIRADVLEWLPGGQTAAVLQRQSELKAQLLNHLNLHGLVGGGGGYASLERS